MFKINEVSDVFVDGVVKDSTGHVLFVSLIGTDTELQALAGRLSLSAGHSDALKSISFRDDDNQSVGLVIPQQVEKVSQRMRNEAMMSGAHVFWFQRLLLPQYWGVGKGYLLIQTTCSAEEFDMKLWQTTKNICRLPLLDHWRTTLLEHVQGAFSLALATS